MRRRLMQFVVGDNWAEFSGPQARERYVEFRRRPPVFNTRTRRFCSTPKTVRDFAAWLETRGYEVTFVGADPGEGRW